MNRKVHSVAFSDRVNGVACTVAASHFSADPDTNIGLEPKQMVVTVDGQEIETSEEDDARLSARAVEVYEEECRR